MLVVATATLQKIDRLAGDTDALLTSDGKPLLADLRTAIKTAEATLQRVDELARAARPGLETLSTETLPETNRLIRDLRELTGSLGAVAAKLDEDPAGALLGGRPLPDYDPKKPETAK
jgi:phospholipid/cholesterol/gamma-HCH transport system substrate-binding protein